MLASASRDRELFINSESGQKGNREKPVVACRPNQHAERVFFPDYVFLAIQCSASAGTRKKNTSTTRNSMKKCKTSLPNSFSSILKRCVAHARAVFRKQHRRAEIKQSE